jgi:hypothetical protein
MINPSNRLVQELQERFFSEEHFEMVYFQPAAAAPFTAQLRVRAEMKEERSGGPGPRHVSVFEGQGLGRILALRRSVAISR